ncbi:MAG: hypothetical protein ACTTKN_03100 [Phocaeicola sp.]|uniref:hypothetical protein n=1 Tax=Phocaeicola sp. TaxID=2773926 RepID=UPI003F9F3345
MKKLVSLICMLLCCISLTIAQNKRLSKEEFRAKQEAFLTEKAELTPDEAKAFFPVYYELQEKKQKINDSAWHKGKKMKEMSDSECEKAMKDMANSKIECAKLDLEYIDQFKKVLPIKKICAILWAEVQFHRHMLKIMHSRVQGREAKKQTQIKQQ